MSKVNFIETEHEILKFWEEQGCFEKLLKKNNGNKPFRFLDGPITANNPMGIHHAWGRSIKDIFIRYKAMNGCSCHYRNGFDTQGLWVEVEVEKELGFKDKKDVEQYGMANFTNKCVQRIKHFSKTITEQSKRLGQWMNWENSYFTHTDENITSIWHFLKVCHENGWIAKSYRPMPWCPRCGTSLSEHEMSGSHKDITHTAVFAKLPVISRDFDILVWTTTPWTLSANVALAVNSELDYALIELDNCERPLMLAKTALKVIDADKKVIKIIKGSELVGLSYETFLPDLPVQKSIIHKIVAWSDVEAAEGSGVVHIAPGCGAEDYDLGKTEGLAEICPVEESGKFTDEYSFLSGKSASEAAPTVFEELARQGKLFKTHEYTHSYPVCWRCKTEVIFRLVREWYIKTDEIKPKLIEAAGNVNWQPAYIGKRMNDWLLNMGDWNISRKRFYGLPLPFYPCEKCGTLTVVGSKKELEELGGSAVNSLPELHRPWIDEIQITCPNCGSSVPRIPEVGDVWLDAGITPFSTLGYFSDREQWNKLFPAEFVIEMREQVRLWFYSQLFMSVTLTEKAPYERVLAHSSVIAEDGSKFSKTGFMIKFDEAAEKVGSDTIRYLFAGANTSSDVRFGYNLGDEARRKLLGFWNIYTFFMTYADIDNPIIENSESENLMDVWLYNRMSRFVSEARDCYDGYNTSDLIREFEICIDDVSNWYVRLCRRRFWKESLDNDKQNAYDTLYYAVKTLCQVMAPIIPFMTEKIWQTMILRYGKAEESVHLSDFPETIKWDENVLTNVNTVREVIAGGMKLRNENQLKVKQPLSILYVDSALRVVCDLFSHEVKEELNIKEIVFLQDFSCLCDDYLQLDFKTAGKVLKEKLSKIKLALEQSSPEQMLEYVKKYRTSEIIVIDGISLSPEILVLLSKDKPNIKRLTGSIAVALDISVSLQLKAEGCYREILRHCQVLRKEAGFDVADRVKFQFSTNSSYLSSVVFDYKESIERETLSEFYELESYKMERMVEINGEKLVIRIG